MEFEAPSLECFGPPQPQEATLDVVSRVAFGGDDVLGDEERRQLREIYHSTTAALEQLTGTPWDLGAVYIWGGFL